MKKLRTILFRFILPTITSCCILFLLYFHFFIAGIVQNRLIELCNDNHCSFRGTVTKQGILYPKIIIHNITIASLDKNEWHWHSPKIECSFSLLRLFTYWSIPVSVEVHALNSFSILRDQHTIALFDFLDLFDDVSGRFFKPYINAMYAQNAEIQIKSKSHDVSAALQFHGRATIAQDGESEITLTITDGCIKQTETAPSYISSISGILQHIHNNQDTKISLQTKGIFTDTQESLYLKGTFENDSGRFSLSTNHPHCFLDPIIYTKHSSKISGQISASFIQKVLQKQEFFEGLIAVQLTCDHTKNNIWRGLFVFEDWVLNTKRLFSSAKITVSSKESTILGPITIKTTLGDFSGNYSYDVNTQTGQCNIKNKLEGKTLLFPFIALHNNSFDCTCNIYKQYLSLHTKFDIFDTLKHKTHTNALDIMVSYNDGMQVRGSSDMMQLTGFFLWKKQYNGILSLCDDEKEVACITMQQDSNGKEHFEGYTQTNIIKTVTELFSEPIPFYGEGTLSFKGTKNNSCLDTQYAFEGGAVDIPHIHNFLLSSYGKLAINSQEEKLSIPQINAVFSTGSLSCNNAEIIYDKNWSIQTCSIPIEINKCAISSHNFFDSLISAHTHIHKKTKHDPFFVSGNVRFHNGFIKNDAPLKKIFAEQHPSSLHTMTQIEHAIDFETEKPIRVETKQIKTDISVKIMSTGNIHAPRMQGSIICSNGEILFPYKPLYITHGKVLLSGGDFSNAIIELFARNIIQNYRIAMRVSGSISEHHVFFDATPVLSQSQISSLLFFGSLQERVSVFVPSLFSHTIKLGSLDIHFVPGFSDKSGRGGIRGALEIGINNRLRAMIQKNFTLSEDTRFELEYAIADTLSLRAVRDERRDLGGELELRWKF